MKVLLKMKKPQQPNHVEKSQRIWSQERIMVEYHLIQVAQHHA